MFYKLKLKEWFYLIVLIFLTYLWINYDQFILVESYQRMIAFPLLGIILMWIFFALVSPEKSLLLSNTMTIILVPLFIILSIVLHIFILKDGLPSKSIILWFMTAGMIYLSGFLYKIFHRK